MLNPSQDLHTAPDGEASTCGRSLLFVRNVGHLMTNPAVLDAEGNGVPEGAPRAAPGHLARGHLHGLTAGRPAELAHGIDLHRQAQDADVEAAFTVRLLAVWRRSSTCRRAPSRWASMDEERRTSVNLKASIDSRRPSGVHQHPRLPRPRSDEIPHLHGGDYDGHQGRDEEGQVDGH